MAGLATRSRMNVSRLSKVFQKKPFGRLAALGPVGEGNEDRQDQAGGDQFQDHELGQAERQIKAEMLRWKDFHEPRIDDVIEGISQHHRVNVSCPARFRSVSVRATESVSAIR